MPGLEFSHVEPVLKRAHGLLEAPVWTDGRLLFSDVMLGDVWSLDPEGRADRLLERRRGIGGIVAAIGAHEFIVSGRDISLVRSGALSPVFGDATAGGFNDLAADHEGRLLAGVLRYRPMQGEEAVPGELIRILPEGRTEVLDDDVLWPNGIVVRPDGTIIYSDFARNHVKALAPGGKPQVFFELPEGSPDGLALDDQGGLWIAGGPAGNLTRVLENGLTDRTVDLPANFVSSLCFGGEELRDIYVTTADNLEQPELGGSVMFARSEFAGAPVPGASTGY